MVRFLSRHMANLFSRHLDDLFSLRRMARGLFLCVVGGSLLSGALSPACSQVLAQRNWAGSGVTVQTWWRRGVFYRIDPRRFQDSIGDGQGDLGGVAERLDYLQSLGVDALILETDPEMDQAAATLKPATPVLRSAGSDPMEPTPEVSAAFDTLMRSAIERHLRVLVELGAPANQSADAQYLAAARAWLSQGASGLYLPTPALQQVDGPEHVAQLVDQLHELTDSFPGQRILLADAPANGDPLVGDALTRDVQLTAAPPLGVLDGAANGNAAEIPAAATLRAAWVAGLSADSDPSGDSASSGRSAQRPGSHADLRVEIGDRILARSTGDPLLVAERVPAMQDPAQQMALERALAMMTLASRSAVLLEYGQELGLETAAGRAPLMQWTPTNLTRKPPPRPAPPRPKPAPNAGYATFLPYVPPLPRDLFPPPPMPEVVESDQPPPVDPALLPGFTRGNFDPALQAPNGATANVALESGQEGSLLNLYRQLIALHHDNATLRDGAEEILDFDALDALVWVRTAPPGSRTSSTVVAACNLSGSPLVLGHDLGAVKVKSLRSALQPEPPDPMKIAPGEVMLGQIR